jgi:DNA-binding NtrC family response regulator
LNFNEQPVPLKQFLNNIERSVIHSALLVTGGSQKQAARILGVKQTALCEKIKRLNIKSSKQKLAVNLPE